jgi:uncharacterized membrane protein
MNKALIFLNILCGLLGVLLSLVTFEDKKGNYLVILFTFLALFLFIFIKREKKFRYKILIFFNVIMFVMLIDSLININMVYDNPQTNQFGIEGIDLKKLKGIH